MVAGSADDLRARISKNDRMNNSELGSR